MPNEVCQGVFREIVPPMGRAMMSHGCPMEGNICHGKWGCLNHGMIHDAADDTVAHPMGHTMAHPVVHPMRYTKVYHAHGVTYGALRDLSMTYPIRHRCSMGVHKNTMHVPWESIKIPCKKHRGGIVGAHKSTMKVNTPP